jgi:hypothetical protein
MSRLTLDWTVGLDLHHHQKESSNKRFQEDEDSFSRLESLTIGMTSDVSNLRKGVHVV